MELLQCDVDSPTCWGTNLREQPSTSDKHRCQQTAKHCNGFTPYFDLEDKTHISLCLSELEGKLPRVFSAY